jgi:hypothetical protein
MELLEIEVVELKESMIEELGQMYDNNGNCGIC